VGGKRVGVGNCDMYGEKGKSLLHTAKRRFQECSMFVCGHCRQPSVRAAGIRDRWAVDGGVGVPGT